MRKEKRGFKDSDALQNLALKIAFALPELSEAQAASFKVFYTNAEMEHIGGKCRKLDGAVRYQTKEDYFILIHRKPFAESDDFHKVRMLVHELFHIEKDEGAFKIRKHRGDFCEIAEHDKFSYQLALKAMLALGIEYDNQEAIARYAGIIQKTTT